MKNEISMAKPSSLKKQAMREKILNKPTIELFNENMIEDFEVGKKVKLEIEGELLNENRGLNKWQLAEGEKQKDSQTVLIHKVKLLK